MKNEEKRPVYGQWLPIATAPTDGTVVLLWFRTCRAPSTGRYDYDCDYAERPKGWMSPDNGWRCDGDDCIPINQDDCTHWMPLPPIPSGGATSSSYSIRFSDGTIIGLAPGDDKQ